MWKVSQRSTNFSTFCAAVLVIVAGLAGGFIASAGGGDEVSSAFEGRVAIVAAQAGAYSEGDIDAWLGYYTPDAELYNGVFSAALPDIRALSRRSFAANDQWVITGLCRDAAADEVACPMRQKDNFHGRAGLAVEAVYTFTFNENDTITAFRLDRGYATAFQPYDSFDFRFLGWLDEAHPEVVIETGVQTDSPMAEDMAIAILYVDEFIEQSDDYPIEP